MKRIFGAALAALLTTSAIAQVNYVPQVGVQSGVINLNAVSVSSGVLDLAIQWTEE